MGNFWRLTELQARGVVGFCSMFENHIIKLVFFLMCLFAPVIHMRWNGQKWKFTNKYFTSLQNSFILGLMPFPEYIINYNNNLSPRIQNCEFNKSLNKYWLEKEPHHESLMCIYSCTYIYKAMKSHHKNETFMILMFLLIPNYTNGIFRKGSTYGKPNKFNSRC